MFILHMLYDVVQDLLQNAFSVIYPDSAVWLYIVMFS